MYVGLLKKGNQEKIRKERGLCALEKTVFSIDSITSEQMAPSGGGEPRKPKRKGRESDNFPGRSRQGSEKPKSPP